MTRWLLLSLLICAAAGCDEQPPPGNGPATMVPMGFKPAAPLDDWQQRVSNALPAGLEATVIDSADNQLLLIDISPQHYEPVLVAAAGSGIAAATALREEKLNLVVGSGFVAETHTLEPVGLLQHEGTVIKPVLTHGYTRILGINDQGLGIIHRRDYQRNLFHSALQVGPGIVEDGELDISERDLQRPRYFRSMLAVCENRWLVGVSLAPSHLRTLGETLLAFLGTAGYRCDEVVNLAGDRQAILALALTDGSMFAHGDATTYKVSLIGFRELER